MYGHLDQRVRVEAFGTLVVDAHLISLFSYLSINAVVSGSLSQRFPQLAAA